MILCFSLISSLRRPSCLLCASRCDSICCSRALWGIGNNSGRDIGNVYKERGERERERDQRERWKQRKTKWVKERRKSHTPVHMWTCKATWHQTHTCAHTDRHSRLCHTWKLRMKWANELMTLTHVTHKYTYCLFTQTNTHTAKTHPWTCAQIWADNEKQQILLPALQECVSTENWMCCMFIFRLHYWVGNSCGLWTELYSLFYNHLFFSG